MKQETGNGRHEVQLDRLIVFWTWGLGLRTPLRFLTAASVCLLVLAGCGGGPLGDVEPTPTPLEAAVPSSGVEPTVEPYRYTDAKGAPFPVPSTEANPILTASREEAWGAGLDIKEIPAAVDAEHVLLLRAVSEDGSFIVGLVVSRQPPRERARLVLMDTDSGRITEVASLQSQSSSSGYSDLLGVTITVDGDWVVWAEGKAIKAYNKATRGLSEIETATHQMAGVPNSYTVPSRRLAVDNGIVVWAEGTDEQPAPGKVASVLKSAELATGRTSIIGRHGINPTISWPRVVWIEPDLTTEIEGVLSSRIVALNMETGETHSWDTLRWWMGEIAIHGDAIVYESASRLNLENLAQTRRQVIRPEQWRAPQHGFTLNDRLVAWASLGPPQVWDRQLERVVNLGGYAQGMEGRSVNGRALAWQSAPSYKDWWGYEERYTIPDNLTIYIMDTAQLSK